MNADFREALLLVLGGLLVILPIYFIMRARAKRQTKDVLSE